MDDPRYFFVVGCPRSGTTLLSVLLDRHSRLCVTPETAFFDEVAPQLTDAGPPLSDILRAWPRLGELGIDPAALFQRLQGRTPDPAEVLAAILDLYAAARGKPRCGEKTPQNLRHVPLILQLFPSAKILCLLRDGREVALSLAAMPWWKPRTLTDAAALWKQCGNLMVQFTAAYPGRFQVIRYEDLVVRPTVVLGSVMQLLGERLEASQFNPTVSTGVVLPRSAAWKGQATEPIRSDSVGLRLSQAILDDIHLLKQELDSDLQRHGYGIE